MSWLNDGVGLFIYQKHNHNRGDGSGSVVSNHFFEQFFPGEKALKYHFFAMKEGFP